jgi:hypothetical protein
MDQFPKPSHTPKAPQLSPKALYHIKPETLDPAMTNPSHQEPCLRLMLISVCNVAMPECAIVYVYTLELRSTKRICDIDVGVAAVRKIGTCVDLEEPADFCLMSDD